jgi:hypothetical protein
MTYEWYSGVEGSWRSSRTGTFPGLKFKDVSRSCIKTFEGFECPTNFKKYLKATVNQEELKESRRIEGLSSTSFKNVQVFYTIAGNDMMYMHGMVYVMV